MPPTPQYVVAITLGFGKGLRLAGKGDCFARRGQVETSLDGTLPISYCAQLLRQLLENWDLGLTVCRTLGVQFALALTVRRR